MEPLQPVDENNHSEGDDPILECYQATFKSHLQDLLKEIDLELVEKKSILKDKQDERKDLGARVYEEQERLVRQQERLHTLNMQYEELLFQCQEGQKQLIDTQKKYDKSKVDLTVEEKTEIELTHQLEKLNHELIQLAKLGHDTSSHCSIMQTINEKSEKDKERLSVEHFEQDLQIHQYMKTLSRLREDINRNKRILQIQKEEASELREHIAEAEVDIKAIHVDFKQLLDHWKNSLLALSKRDEALASIKSVLSKCQSDVQSLTTEKKKYENILQQEFEKNEQLTLICNQKKAGISRLKKTKENLEKNAESSYQVCLLLESAIKQSESSYNQLTQDLISQEKELKAVEEAIQNKKEECSALENKRIDMVHAKARNNSTCKSIHQSIKKMQERIADTENISLEEETKLGKQLLKIVEIKLSCEMLKEQFSNLRKESEEINKECAECEKKIQGMEFTKRNKSRRLEELNRSMMHCSNSTEEDVAVALKNSITFLTHDIKAIELECSNAESKWLQQQCELIRLSKQFAIMIKEITDQKLQLAVYDAKRLRTEEEISYENKEVINLEHEIQNLQNDIIRLNVLLQKKENIHGNLKEQSVLIEYDCLEKLKKEELEYIQAENAINNLKNKSQMLINQIIKAERESLAWRRKIQQAEETKKRLTLHLHSDVKSCKTEMHQIELQQRSLKREKEILQLDLEKAVNHHAALYAKADIKNTLKSLKKDNKDSFERQENNIRRKITYIQKLTEEHEQMLEELQEQRLKTEYKIEKCKTQKASLEYQLHHKNEEIKSVHSEKYQNLMKLALKQQRLKYYEDIKNNRYRVAVKSYGMHEIEASKIKHQLDLMKKISEEISKQYPSTAEDFSKVVNCIECSHML